MKRRQNNAPAKAAKTETQTTDLETLNGKNGTNGTEEEEAQQGVRFSVTGFVKDEQKVVIRGIPNRGELRRVLKVMKAFGATKADVVEIRPTSTKTVEL